MQPYTFHINITETVKTYETVTTDHKDFNSRYNINPESGKASKIGWWDRKVQWISQLLGLGKAEQVRMNSARIGVAQNIFSDVKQHVDSYKELQQEGSLPQAMKLEYQQLVREVELARALLTGLKDQTQLETSQQLAGKLDEQLNQLNALLQQMDAPLPQPNAEAINGPVEAAAPKVYGTGIDAFDQNFDTALIVACRSEDLKEIDRLIETGANLEARNLDGQTPLLEACEYGNYEAIDLLLKAGANLEARNFDGQTPLMEACQSGNTELVSLLILARAKVDTTNEDNETPLVEACRSENIELIKILIRADANIDARNAKGDTPLIEACRASKPHSKAVVELLLNAGADAAAVGKDGKTALELATKLGDQQMIELLSKRFKSLE